LSSAKSRDVGETDTVTVVKDFLADVLGYDKYSELTSEHLIRGTYCDLAVKIDGKLSWLIEVKAIGIELKDAHVKQAVDYAANQGCEWVVLTNGGRWMVFRVSFAKPISHELIADIDVLALNPRKDEDSRLLWLLSREGWLKSHLDDFAAQREVLSKYTIAAILQTESILGEIRKELRRLNPDLRFELSAIADVLKGEVIKREALEGEKAATAASAIKKATLRALRQKNSSNGAAKAEPKPIDAEQSTMAT
jgi:predicted type IV restriction endonuclease